MGSGLFSITTFRLKVYSFELKFKIENSFTVS